MCEPIKYKASVEAQGEGVVITVVYAPVSSHVSLRIFLALDANRKFYVHHLDVKAACLNGSLDEEIRDSERVREKNAPKLTE